MVACEFVTCAIAVCCLLSGDDPPQVDIPGINCDIELVRLARFGAVQGQLDMTDAQKGDIEVACLMLDDGIRDAKNEIKSATNFANTVKKLRELRKSYLHNQAEIEKELPKILNESQLARLRATRWKAMGAAAAFSEGLDREIAVTPMQKDRMTKICNEWWRLEDELSMRRRKDSVESMALREVESILTSSQRDQLVNLSKAAVDFKDVGNLEKAIVRRTHVVVDSPVKRTTWLRMVANPLIAAELRLSDGSKKAIEGLLRDVEALREEVDFVAGEIPRRESLSLSILLSRASRNDNPFAKLGRDLEKKSLEVLNEENLDILRGLRLGANSGAEVFNPALKDYFGITKQQQDLANSIIDRAMAQDPGEANNRPLTDEFLSVLSKEQREKYDRLKRPPLSRPLKDAVLSTLF